MTNISSYAHYVKVAPNIESDDVVELPVEENSTLLLSTIRSQYGHATGLKFRLDCGEWKDVRLAGDGFAPPDDGWGDREYYVTPYAAGSDSGKRKQSDYSDSEPAKRKKADDEINSDLIVLGLPYSSVEEDLRKYFEKFGELEMHEIKRKPDGKSKGFGFVRFKDKEVIQEVLKLNHSIGGRRCDVRLPKKQDDTPTKLFIGRLKEGTTTDDLRDHFSTYGNLTDVYIPQNFRGFGFVTFETQEAAREVINNSHIIKGATVNVNFADPRNPKSSYNMQYGQQQPMPGGYGGGGYNNDRGYGGGSYSGGYSGGSGGGGGKGGYATYVGNRYPAYNAY